MSGIEVTKKQNSWQVVTQSGSFTVEDKNENGKIDKEDVWSSANGGSLPSTDEMEEAMGLSLKKEKMTSLEIAEYNKFQENLKAKEEYKQRQTQQQQQYQTQTQTQPKQKWWEKAAQISLAALTPLSLMGSIMLGSGIGSSYYNSGNGNDRSLQWFGGITALMTGMSAMAPMLMKNKNNQAAGMYQNQGGFNFNASGNNNWGSSFSEAWKVQQEYDNQRIQATVEANKRAQEKAEQQKAENETKANKDLIQKTINAAAGESNVTKANKDYLDTLKDPDKTRVYTEKEIENVKQINSTRSIPVNHIDPKGEAKNKITKGLAENLQELLNTFDEKTGDLKYDVISKKNYTELKAILDKPQLTEADVDKLRSIYNKPTEDK